MPDELEAVAAFEAEHLNNWSELGGGAAEARAAFLATLDDTQAALRVAAVPHLFIGGIASAVYGRPRVTHDVDVMVRPEHARPFTEALADHGFDIDERAPHWLFKAHRDDQVIDIIFKSSGDVYLDDEMLAHATRREFCGRVLPLMSPEDLVVCKALAHDEPMPRHWHDALGVLADSPIDWPYLVRRAGRGPRRVLALLFYAQSNDLPVPHEAVAELLRYVDERFAPVDRMRAS